MTQAGPSRRWRPGFATLALAIAIAAGIIGYLPTLNSPLYLDDYIYLGAARQLSLAHYARLSFTPWSHDSLLPFTRDFWRPLSFLYFALTEPVFGGHVLPYHLVNLGVHLVSIGMVWLLARRLDPRPLVAGTAVVVFALYPGSTEAVSWISSANSAGLPFALGCWLVFLIATESSGLRWPLVVVSAGLLAVALMFRETSATIVVPLGLWFVLVQRRESLKNIRTFLPLVPLAAVLVGYYLIRTRLFSEPAANPDIYGFDSTFPDHWWYFIKNALLPFRDPVIGWRVHAQDVSGVVYLACIPLAFALRRWGLAALLASLPIAVVPSALALLGVGQRYFYFSTPVLAVALGLVAAEFADRFADRLPERVPAMGAGLFATLVVSAAGAAIVFDRNTHWEEIGPTRDRAWVGELRAEYPTLPEGGVLYCVNVPLELVLYDAANLEPIVRWYYPGVGAAVWASDAAKIPALGPNDRVFIAGDGQLLGDTRDKR